MSKKDKILAKIKATITRHDDIDNWLEKHPYVTGSLGNLDSPVWFVAENPNIENLKEGETDENKQWGTSETSAFLRGALKKAGLKSGHIWAPDGWNCYLTNADKTPMVVRTRNKNKNEKKSELLRKWACQWQDVMQLQINLGAPKVLVAFGESSCKMLEFMKKNGLSMPPIVKIHHYSYIMKRPDRSTGFGPRHPIRKKEFEEDIARIAREYS